ncbi:MAG TPA: type IV secretory system conjugative DNA transfer family protein [Chloroflexaceae bacterium]|nr:type IV secretory system conjugative DNA transfer family protein [Chloroflexaceae bacterium]
MSDATYGPDILIALVSTATFGGWGLAGAAVFSLARHSPVVRDGVSQLAPQLADARRRLPELLTATPARHALARRPGPAGAPTPPALFAELEAPPHRLIVGHTGGGKTTLMHHLATAWAAQQQQVVVIDPDAAPGQWPGCTVAGGGDDRDGAARALASVAQVVAQRRQERAQGRRAFPALHLVIDEAHDVLPDVPGAFEVFEDVARRGRKIGVRLTLGVQDKQVKTLGLEGRSELLRNFVKADVFKGRDGRRVARLEDTLTGRHVDHPVPTLRDPETLIRDARRPVPADAPRAEAVTMRVPARGPADEPAALLATLMAELPADVRAAVPSISPERERRLAAILAGRGVPAHQDAEITPARSVTVPSNGNGDARSAVAVEASNGGGVTVNVQQIAGGRAMPKSGGLNVKARRLRATYRTAGAEGVPFRAAYEQHGGSRNDVFRAWQAGRATRKDA